MFGVIAVITIAMYQTNDVHEHVLSEKILKEGISGGVEAQMTAGSGRGLGGDNYGLYGGGSGQIVPANAAYSNIDAYATGQGKGYAPSAPSTPPRKGVSGVATEQANNRYLPPQRPLRAYQGRVPRRRFPWPLSLIFG